MSATTDTPMGGFEQRLLAQLRAEIAERPPELIQTTPVPSTPARPAPRSSRLRVPTWRLPAVASAAIAALVVAVLSVLPAASPSLAQAFPIITERTHVLPVRMARALRSQWLASPAPRFDLRHAYAFTTPAGTGYVVVDRRARWLCILVPGFSAGSTSGRCERVALARLGDPALSLRISGSAHREEIVALLPRHASVSSTTTFAGHARRLELHDGLLAIVSRGPVSVTTNVNGRSSSTDYTP
jgi:hypothetical protein